MQAQHPDDQKAMDYVASFDYAAWSGELKDFLGASADTMIALEAKEQKYSKQAHAARFQRIKTCWDEILQIIREELPEYGQFRDLMKTIGISEDMETIGVDPACAKQTFRATKDIRDKYVLSRLAWDLGILEELCERI